MSRSNGRPEPEVIIEFADGMSYNKIKLEEAYRTGGILEKPIKHVSKETRPVLKKDDIDLIVHELDVSRAQAEKALIENAGNIKRALEKLIQA
ncbi:hypothetical protein QCA50_003485 [Cerrena zonata]|uniref:Nascent polypeptide-associated complex subunit alpha-like UBA domain-containing protein n=1 Tax=Cerrena zonata TaxID=2478898 RepID=A0AAW0GMC6_9APHY